MLSKPKTCWGQLKSLKVWFIGELVKNPTVGKNPKIRQRSLGLVDNPYICSCGLSSIKLVSMLAGIILDSNSPRALKLFNSLCYSPEHMVPLTHIHYPLYGAITSTLIASWQWATKVTYKLREGDTVVFDNLRVMHGRFGFISTTIFINHNHNSQESQSYFSEITIIIDRNHNQNSQKSQSKFSEIIIKVLRNHNHNSQKSQLTEITTKILRNHNQSSQKS